MITGSESDAHREQMEAGLTPWTDVFVQAGMAAQWQDGKENCNGTSLRGSSGQSVGLGTIANKPLCTFQGKGAQQSAWPALLLIRKVIDDKSSLR